MTRLHLTCLLWLTLMLTSCGDDESDPCAVVGTDAGGALITCGADQVAVDPGVPGPPGEDGKPGEDGTTCSVTEDEAGGALIECDDGSSVLVPAGMEGQQGQAGPQGPTGQGARIADAGMNFEIISAQIGDDRRPQLRLRMSDTAGIGLDRTGLATGGSVSVSFTVAALQEDSDGVFGDYKAYILKPQTSPITMVTENQPSSENDGDWRDVDPNDGVYEYTFKTVLPQDFSQGLTHTIALWGSRTVDGVRYVGNAKRDFRPDEGELMHERDIAPTASCNGCHNPLALHGGQRLETSLCITCHTPQAVDPDTDNSVDMKVMAHKIHQGANLPSVLGGVPYQIIGYNQSVHDYSTVQYPQEINHCDSCHQGQEGDRWKTQPSRAACGSCHDDVDFDLPAGDPGSGYQVPHTAGAKEDGTCTTCHSAQKVEDVHSRGSLNSSRPVLSLEILGATDTGPTETPTVTFRVQVDGVGRDIVGDPLDRLAVVFGGPTTDFAGQQSYDPQSDDSGSTTDMLVAVNAGAGEFAYTFPETVQEAAAKFTVATAAEGSFRIMMEGRHEFDVARPGGGQESIRVGAINPVLDVEVTGGAVLDRRELVSDALCNSCHRELGFHGGIRTSVQACVVCHNPNLDTFGRQPDASSSTPEATSSVRFGTLIHRVHGAEIASNPYTLYSSRGDALDFSDKRFPGAAADCESCHTSLPDLPLPEGVLESRTRLKDDNGQEVPPAALTPPTQAACASCHDSAASALHSDLQTSGSAESCAVCHGAGRSGGIDAVHTRAQWDY